MIDIILFIEGFDIIDNAGPLLISSISKYFMEVFLSINTAVNDLSDTATFR